MRTVILLFLLTIFLSASGQSPDYILYNGKIFTSDNSQLYVEALAVTKNKITAIGKTDDILKLSGSGTKKINLAGKTVTPGFNDAHYHHVPPYIGRYLRFPIEGPGAPSRKMVEDSISHLVKSLPKGTWIHASLGPEVMTDKSLDRFALDKIAADHPVRLTSFWGHVSIYNTIALKKLNVLEKQPDVKGGYFERQPGTNVITGQVFDDAQYFIPELRKFIDAEKFPASLQQLSNEALALGVTSLQNMCTFAPPDTYIFNWKKAGLPIRFRLIRWADMDQRGNLLIPQDKLNPRELPLLTVSGIKWMIEGTPIEKNAYYKAAYLEPSGWHGKLYFNHDDITKMLTSTLAKKQQNIFHLAGDSLTELVLNAMEHLKEVNWKEQRARIEHGTGITPAMISKIKSLGVVVVVNPIHPGMGTNPSFLVNEADRDFDPVKSLLTANIPMAIGSDGPLNPYLNIMFAVMRRTEKLSVEEAVIAYTKTSAYAEFADGDKGTLMPGKVADLIVLSQDIFSVPPPQLPSTHSLFTMVNGVVAFSTPDVKVE